MIALTKDTISERGAKLWIYGAVGMAVLSGLLTILAATKGLLGLTAWNLLDVGVCFALAYGVYRRSLVCAWFLLGYYLLNRVWLFINAGVVPSSKAITYILFYSMAIVSIGLYPRSAKSSNHGPSGSADPVEFKDGGRVV